MAKLIYVSNVSLDGYIEDAHGGFEWTEPDDEDFAFITDLVRPSAPTSTGGACTRRWPSGRPIPPWPPSRSSWPTSRTSGRRRTRSSTPRPWTRSRPPTPGSSAASIPTAVREMKAPRSDLIVGGPTLAAHAFSAGLVDECHLFIWPVLVGGGKPALPSDAASGSSCSTSAGSTTASCTSATAPRADSPGGTG